MEGGSCFYRLPEECISHILSLTSPRDSCRFSLVSSTFRSVASCDTLWERFLPSDYREILSRAVDPVGFSSFKDLYFRLCDSIVIDEGTKIFALERANGGKCYILGARELDYERRDDSKYQRWVSRHSRFPKVTELVCFRLLEIYGKIDSRVLSPKTTYAAYLIFKVSVDSYGLKNEHQKTSVKVGNQESKHAVCLEPDERFLTPQEVEEPKEIPEIPHVRDDGWMEIEMGVFFNNEGDDGEVEMSLEVDGRKWKRGLVVEGIEVRPKK